MKKDFSSLNGNGNGNKNPKKARKYKDKKQKQIEKAFKAGSDLVDTVFDIIEAVEEIIND